MRSTTPPQPCQRRVRRAIWALLSLIATTVAGIQRAAAVAATPPTFSDTLAAPVESPTTQAFPLDSYQTAPWQAGLLHPAPFAEL
jgi:hypothetical protein